ncbi:MAG: hypothetical protein EOO15_16345 [Chitinophagaceae bacterium]|nr:MAG: hypothetical protein EOO15_16345 [Chitinophagaceae bacterium]
MRLTHALVALVLVLLALHGNKAFATEPNGCGSGWSLRFVPDNVRFLSCKFKSSCDNHDRCYDKCGDSLTGVCEYRRCRPDGDLYQTVECATSEQLKALTFAATKRREVCDSKLHDEIVASNPGWACRAIAIVYREAVKEWGDGNFSGYGTRAMPAAWKQSQKDYEEAIQRFFQSASEAELEQFVQSFDNGHPSVNFCGRIQFKDRKLQNLNATDRKACGAEVKP